MNKVVRLVPMPPAQFCCDRCENILFHWFDGYVMCVMCGETYATDGNPEPQQVQ
jgi:uncharacterized Zn finger protein (UPF0148 family)